MPSATENPKHEDIEKRAYELYLQSGEQFSATEYWLLAEQELKQNVAGDAVPLKKKAATTGFSRE